MLYQYKYLDSKSPGETMSVTANPTVLARTAQVCGEDNGEQDTPDIQKQARDCSRFVHRSFFR
jgi:hypothetical protein